MDRHLRARVLLAEATALGLDLSDLAAAATPSIPPVPTVAEWVATVEPTFTARTAATYRPYWRLAITCVGDDRLTDVSVVDLQVVVTAAVTRARQQRPGSSGRSSQETCVAALRALFARAVAAGLLVTNPAAALAKPRRTRSRRRALTDRELSELIDAIRATSNDPALDLLLVRFHLESGARRQGALNLRLGDLDPNRATVWLREKNDSEREQPITPNLITLFQRHAEGRGAREPNDPVFRRRAGNPITARRYDRIFTHARRCLPWATRTPVSAHVLRHTAITAVARLAGYPVAQTFAGHTPPSATGHYTQATIDHVATAIAHLTNQPHPLAQDWRHSRPILQPRKPVRRSVRRNAPCHAP